MGKDENERRYLTNNDKEKDESITSYNKAILDVLGSSLIDISKVIQPSISMTKQLKAKAEAFKGISDIVPRFPKITLPKIEIDYEKIEKIINHNSAYGWTMTAEINSLVYMDESLLELNEEQLDNLFLEYFEENSMENVNRLKTVLLEEAEDQWIDVLEECFNLYEKDRFTIIIPMLMSIIESEIAAIAKSDDYSTMLFKEWSRQISEKQKLDLIISRSVHSYIKTNLFGYSDFGKVRKRLNRNRVLHGRDDPRLWKKADALKLLNLISSLQFVKGFDNEE